MTPTGTTRALARETASALAHARLASLNVGGTPEIPENVELGRGARIDLDARVGILPLRQLDSPLLRIGDRACLRSGVAIYAGCVIGSDLDVGHNTVIRENTKIGDEVWIGDNVVIAPDCSIGSRVRIGPSAYIAAQTKIEDDAEIAAGAMLADDPHPGSATRFCSRGPSIGRGAQIGMNATVLPAMNVGARALVGAGAVVTRNVDEGMVVVGNPARPLKPVSGVSCPLDLQAGDYLRVPARRATRKREGGAKRW